MHISKRFCCDRDKVRARARDYSKNTHSNDVFVAVCMLG